MSCRRLLLAHLPILLSATIAVAFSSDARVFRPLHTEQSFAWFVVVLVPLATLLALVQLAIWLVWARRRFG
jgi:hypothetical protein